jgi:hypothetical protein
VGNEIVSLEKLDMLGIKSYEDSFDEAQFKVAFGVNYHRFTGVDYVAYYKSLGDNIEIVFSNDPIHLLNYTDQVLCCDVHKRFRSQGLLQKAGAKTVYRLDQILNSPIDGSGCNPDFGLLGANLAGEGKLKLFPRDCESFVYDLQAKLLAGSGVKLEVMIYGDGGFKDPQGGIWELIDPVISPAFTDGLIGVPNELKMKYLLDGELKELDSIQQDEKMREMINSKATSLVGDMASLGTTPRFLSDLLGSLADLVSGSGDRGTPVVLIQGYFSNFASM